MVQQMYKARFHSGRLYHRKKSSTSRFIHLKMETELG
jgi:hypothetical protein